MDRKLRPSPLLILVYIRVNINITKHTYKGASLPRHACCATALPGSHVELEITMEAEIQSGGVIF